MVCINGVEYRRTDCGKMIPANEDHEECIPCILTFCQAV